MVGLERHVAKRAHALSVAVIKQSCGSKPMMVGLFL